jgi:hypothetical protein
VNPAPATGRRWAAPHLAERLAARPITVEQPIWRADLLESADGPPASFDRTHHHPAFTGWDPSARNFVPELSADPVGWVSNRLLDLDAVLADAGLSSADVGANDAAELRAAVPEIADALRRLLARVHAGELAKVPETELEMARISWL